MTIRAAFVLIAFVIFVAYIIYVYVMNPKNIDVWLEFLLFLLTLAVVFIVLP